MERYLPLNLLATVISCRSVQPRSEMTWWAAAGGWWLTCRGEEDSANVQVQLNTEEDAWEMEKKDKNQACHTGANKYLLKITNPF